MSNEKHAYLILCHNHFRQLNALLGLLDDERNDIFIHMDKKSGAYPEADLRKAVQKSGLFFTERIRANWGGYSLVRAELILLEEAVKRGYGYYHLMSGADLPLKTQDEIHRFFDENAGKEFIYYSDSRNFLFRIAYYHPLKELYGKGFHSQTEWRKKIAVFPISGMAKAIWKIQSFLSVDRLGNGRDLFFMGSQWFSVTHGLASHILARKAFIERYFRLSLAADEIFVQTIAMDSPFRDGIVRDNLRLIDWKRGNPYVFRSEDYDLLMSSGCLFARKFDEDTDSEIIGRISRELRRNSAKP